MSWTGLDLRGRARRRLVRVLDHLVDRLEVDDDASPAPAAAPAAADEAPDPPPTTPADATAKPAPKPLPSVDKAKAGPIVADAPSEAAAGSPRRNGTPPGSPPPRASAEDRQAQHWARTRAGLLHFVHDQGGKASLRELHDYSERTFFVAHVGFSRMMEELTDDGVLDYDHDAAMATLTDAGRAELG